MLIPHACEQARIYKSLANVPRPLGLEPRIAPAAYFRLNQADASDVFGQWVSVEKPASIRRLQAL